MTDLVLRELGRRPETDSDWARLFMARLRAGVGCPCRPGLWCPRCCGLAYPDVVALLAHCGHVGARLAMGQASITPAPCDCVPVSWGVPCEKCGRSLVSDYADMAVWIEGLARFGDPILVKASLASAERASLSSSDSVILRARETVRAGKKFEADPSPARLIEWRLRWIGAQGFRWLTRPMVELSYQPGSTHPRLARTRAEVLDAVSVIDGVERHGSRLIGEAIRGELISWALMI